MNMNTQGIQAKIAACVGSVGVGFSFCCSHMVTPSRIGSTPIKISAMIEVGSGVATMSPSLSHSSTRVLLSHRRQPSKRYGISKAY